MLKKIYLTCSALLAASVVFAEGTVKLADVEFSVDTLFHAKVGPGTTQTSLHLINTTNTGQQLRVFYLTVDLRNPTVAIKSVIAQDKLSGGATTSSMATDHSSSGKTYYAGINTDFFYTSGSATNGVSLVGTPVRAAMAEGEIYRTEGASSTWPNFYIGEDGLPYIGAVSFSNGVAECNGNSVSFSVVNNDAGDNTLSVYTPKYYGVMNQPSLAGSCAEVTAKMVEGENIAIGKTVKLEVTSTATSTGDREIPDGEYLLVGRGSTLDFVNGLAVGDVVSLTAQAAVDGVSIVPTELCTANPNILANGVTLQSEGDRGDAVARHPRSSIGYSGDKSTMIMMVIDGRSSISAGVHTMELADMMHYAGADYAVNVDGGGSSTLYTLPLGVRNNPSDGKERAVSAAMFCVSNAPDDETVAEIRFVDWSMKFPKYGIYTPVFYGYNQYGMLIDTNLQGVTLQCDSKIGEITNNGTTFYGTGDGTGALTASYNGLTASIPVTVAQSDNVSLRLNNILIDNKREYAVEVQALVNETYMPVNAAALSWSSSDEGIATVGATDGVLKGVANGSTTIIGTVGNFTGQTNVTVEIPEGEVMPVLRKFPTDGWTLKQTGGTGLSIAESDNGFKLNYTGDGKSRGAYISVEKDMQVWSLPEAIRLRINPGNASVKKVTLNAQNALDGKTTSWVSSVTEFPLNQETLATFPLSDWCDPTDIGIYPITILSVRFDMNASENGEAFELQVPGFEAYYGEDASVSSPVESAVFKLYPNPVVAGSSVMIETDGKATVSVFALNGTKVSEFVGNGSVSLSTENMKGLYLVQVATGTSFKVAKLLVK